MTPVEERIGSWLSAALDDPQVCQEMKDDITAWMEKVYWRDELTEQQWQLHNDIDRLTRERDAAIAQRDRAVASGSAVWDAWHGGCNPGKAIIALAAVLDGIADTPVPDRLAAEREAGRREGIEAVERAIIARDNRYAGPEWRDGKRAMLDVVRALRDTPAAPETGKTEGGETQSAAEPIGRKEGGSDGPS